MQMSGFAQIRTIGAAFPARALAATEDGQDYNRRSTPSRVMRAAPRSAIGVATILPIARFGQIEFSDE